MHGVNNYPLFKATSSWDIELPDRTADETYLETLANSFDRIFSHEPEIVFYLAGADPYVNDKLGKLSVTLDGLKKRDTLVLRECYKREVPATTVMSGGYGKQIGDTVEIHCNTIRAVKQVFEAQTIETLTSPSACAQTA